MHGACRDGIGGGREVKEGKLKAVGEGHLKKVGKGRGEWGGWVRAGHAGRHAGASAVPWCMNQQKKGTVGQGGPPCGFLYLQGR